MSTDASSLAPANVIDLSAWSRPAVGFRLIGWGIVLLLIPLLLPVLLLVPLPESMVLQLIRLLPALVWGATILCMIGFGLCTRAPDVARSKRWIIAAAVGIVLSSLLSQLRLPVLQWVYDQGYHQAAVVTLKAAPHLTNLLNLASVGAFLFWVQAVARHFQSAREAKSAMDLMKTGAVIVFIFSAAIAWFVMHAAGGGAPARGGDDTVAMLLSLILPGCGIAALIWIAGLASLMFRMRRLLRKAPTAAE